jgi:hypothetical protein
MKPLKVNEVIILVKQGLYQKMVKITVASFVKSSIKTTIIDL